MNMLLLAPIAGLITVLFAGYLAWSILRKEQGNEKMRSIAQAIQEGSSAYLNRQYKTIAIIAAILFVVLFFAINWQTAVAFIVGATLSGAAGYIGMNISVRANVRTAQAAKSGLAAALDLAFKGGAVTGLSIVGLSLIGVSGFYIYFRSIGTPLELIPIYLVGFGFGASLISLFARIGGGIFTKAADVGADLVGKVEAGIPEDDPRNPAVIADNVGDNVGDCAGMGADLFETYAVTAIGAILLGHLAFPAGAETGMLYPMMLGAVAVITSIIGTFFVRLGKTNNIMMALYKPLIVSGLAAAVGFYWLTVYMHVPMTLYYASLVGLAVTVAINVITEYYTSTEYRPVKEVAEASVTGPATNIIAGLAVGLRATAFPVLVICAGILASFFIAGGAANPIMGLYGISIAAMAMLSLTGIIVAIDSYGPITDNAGGIAEMAGLPDNVRKITDALDAVGNTTKAVTKGYAIGSAALAALALFVAYTEEINRAAGKTFTLLLNDPVILVGLFLGAVVPFVFSAMAMKAVGTAAQSIIVEVRRQFKTIKGIMQGKAKPDYAACVDIVTKSALKEMMAPALLAVISPLAVGFILGPSALGAMLLGTIISGLMVAIQMTTGGAAWDNAKKYIEAGNLGGKKLKNGERNPTHSAAVVGDTVGDPYKDTAGPAINALIKVMNTIALIFAAVIVNYALF